MSWKTCCICASIRAFNLGAVKCSLDPARLPKIDPKRIKPRSGYGCCSRQLGEVFSTVVAFLLMRTSPNAVSSSANTACRLTIKTVLAVIL